MKKHRIYIFSFFSLLTTRPNNSEKQQFTVSIAFKKIFCKTKKNILILQPQKMVSIAQLVRVADCGSVGRGFESHYSPKFIEN